MNVILMNVIARQRDAAPRRAAGGKRPQFVGRFAVVQWHAQLKLFVIARMRSIRGNLDKIGVKNDSCVDPSSIHSRLPRRGVSPLLAMTPGEPQVGNAGLTPVKVYLELRIVKSESESLSIINKLFTNFPNKCLTLAAAYVKISGKRTVFRQIFFRFNADFSQIFFSSEKNQRDCKLQCIANYSVYLIESARFFITFG